MDKGSGDQLVMPGRLKTLCGLEGGCGVGSQACGVEWKLDLSLGRRKPHLSSGAAQS